MTLFFCNGTIFNIKNDELFFSEGNSLSKVFIYGKKGSNSRDIWRHRFWHDVVLVTAAIINEISILRTQ